MQKRGQVTIFLVVGIVILLLTALLFFVVSKAGEEAFEIEEREVTAFQWVKPALQLFIEDCMKEIADPSVYLLAIQGGIIYPSENSQILLTDYGLINYAWINGIKGLSKKKMELDLASYLEEYIDFCVGDFETFEKQGILVLVDYDKIEADFKIQNKVINILLDFPLTVNLPTGDEISIKTFSVQLRSSLGEMLNAVEKLNMPNVDIYDLIGLPYQPMVFPYDESVVVYSLAQNNPEEPLAFMFAIRDDYPANEPPILDYIPDKTFTVGNRWQEVLYADDPNNDLLEFSSDSSVFPISEDGTIGVEITNSGIFDVTFTVEDGRGGEDEQEVSILVLE